MAESHPQSLLDALRPRLAAVASLDAEALEAEQITVLGRKSGALTALLRSLATLSPEDKRVVGAAANELRQAFEAAFEARRAALAGAAESHAALGLDLTMPGRRRWVGAEHPATRVVEEICEIFHGLGFNRAIGPEAETEWANFGALNFPADHPAMDMHDTFYLDVGGNARPGDGKAVLLRTHTSPVQVRTMMAGPPPIRVVIPGVVYRKDPFDPSHAPVFWQVEGLAVDEGISFVDLKGTLLHFARQFFSASTEVRFRPSYFPFTEPSAEMDVSCYLCKGAGCAACKGTGWMEILGCGMVHPTVLENCGVDAERYTGFAFGMGPQRIAMQRYGIPDIRLLFEGDMRFLGQLGGGR